MYQEIAQKIISIVRELYALDVSVELTVPEEQFGDYATNVALQISKQLGKNPREVADEVVQRLDHSSIASAEVAGPGFINITLKDAALLSRAEQSPQQGRGGATVVIETNNPNPFKAMHIGHAFNAIVADALANLIENDGARTYRVSYHGDVGLHVGRSMYSLLKYVNGDAGKLDSIPPAERNSFMSRMYAEGSKAYKTDAQAKAEIEELTKQSFTREDPLYAEVYDMCLEWSFADIDAAVERLGNKPIVKRFLESEAEYRGVEIVKKNVPSVFQESDGALIFKGSEHGSFDNVFVSARGTGLYAARDLGLIKLKNEQYHPDKSYIVTAEEQRAYFKGVLAAADACMPEAKGVTVNIPTGTVKLATGKMSSRDGDVIEIAWLFEQIEEAIRKRGGSVDQAVVAGALRYEFLRVRIGGDVVFDINEAVSVEGNSGPYLQYAHARACSILKKGPQENAGSDDTALEPGERSMVRKLGEYSTAVERASAELAPHQVCTYLYELCQAFNRFYEHNKVLGSDREDIRLKIVRLYAGVLKNGLELLGMEAPERM